ARTSIDDPAQHAQVLAEAGPQKPAILVLSEPVDVKDPRRLAHPSLEAEPVSPVVAEVVAAEGLHRHGVATYHPDLAYGCGRVFRGHTPAEQHAVTPVARLVHQRCHLAPPAAEQDRGDRYALGRFGERRV